MYIFYRKNSDHKMIFETCNLSSRFLSESLEFNAMNNHEMTLVNY